MPYLPVKKILIRIATAKNILKCKAKAQEKQLYRLRPIIRFAHPKIKSKRILNPEIALAPGFQLYRRNHVDYIFDSTKQFIQMIVEDNNFHCVPAFGIFGPLAKYE